MIHLPGVLAAAEDVQAFCQRHEWGFCFIGRMAAQRWGEPRLTQDVDLTAIARTERRMEALEKSKPDFHGGKTFANPALATHANRTNL